MASDIARGLATGLASEYNEKTFLALRFPVACRRESSTVYSSIISHVSKFIRIFCAVNGPREYVTGILLFYLLISDCGTTFYSKRNLASMAEMRKGSRE